MLKDFDFHVLQLRYIKAAINDIAAYKPDGMTAAAVDLVLTDAGTTRQTYIDAKSTFDLSRGEYREAVNEGHDAAIGVYAAMKSRYRKDPGTSDAINNLPVDDQTADATIKRMQQMSSLWAKLPNVGSPPAAFVAWQGMDKTAFAALLTTIVNRQKTLPDDDQAFQVAEGNLHQTDEGMSDIITAALTQGRAQFRSGMEREVIDAVPSEPAEHAPDEAEITLITAPGGGVVHLEFDADHATSFDVFQKLQSAPDFTKVVDDGIARTYDASGLSAGKTYDFKVIGRNSLGEGPESAVKSIDAA